MMAVGKRVKDYQLPRFKKKKPSNISFTSHFSAKPPNSGVRETVRIKEKITAAEGSLVKWA